MMRTLVLLTLNEIDGLRAVWPKVPRTSADDIVAVDGGSTDGTCEFLASNGVTVFGQDVRGRGEAFRVALRRAPGDHLVFFSPDGNEAPQDIPRLFDALASGADMAIASRFAPGGVNEEDADWLPLRKWTNQMFTLAANMLWNRGSYVSDTINGFRGVTRAAFMRLAPQSQGYTIEYEMTVRAMKQRMCIREIPTVEGQRIAGVTKGPSMHVGLAFLRFFARELFS